MILPFVDLPQWEDRPFFPNFLFTYEDRINTPTEVDLLTTAVPHTDALAVWWYCAWGLSNLVKGSSSSL